ncbi:MAG: aquaporin family protein [Acidobacteriia bacterium]|nr:aquaporin family protein [Terriglobia bacterium]
MKTIAGELVGTALLVLLGDGVVAACLLKRSKAQNAGWMVITTGWAMAVAVAVYAVFRISGAHLNPAITLALALTGKFPWAQVPFYLIAQLVGGFLGGVLVWLSYLPHWRETEEPDLKLMVFSTVPAIRRLPANLLTEVIGTFVLMFGVLAILANTAPLESGLAPLLIGFLVWAIGLSLGAPTGYAINPARDLGPRLAHMVLPIPYKGSSDWGYAWVPVVGPVLGGALGAFAYVKLFG